MAEDNIKSTTTETYTAPQPEKVGGLAEGKVDGLAPANKNPLSVNESASERQQRISDSLKGMLTADERHALEQEQKKLNGDSGQTKQTHNNNYHKQEEDPDKFKEDDIINYMYNEWLIALFCWAGKKLEEGLANGYYWLKARYKDAKELSEEDKKQFENSKFSKNSEKVYKLCDQEDKAIDERAKRQEEEIKSLGQMIVEGKLTATSANDAKRLCNIMGIDILQADKNPQTKEIIGTSLVYQTNKEAAYQTLGITEEDVKKDPQIADKKMQELKNDGSKKDLYEATQKRLKAMLDAKENLCKIGADFAKRERDNSRYITRVEKTALKISTSQILDAMTRDQQSLDGKDIDSLFKNTFNDNVSKITKATNQEKDNKVNGKSVKIIKEEKLEHYSKLAEEALKRVKENIANSQIAELGGNPAPNKEFKEYEDAIKKALNQKHHDNGKDDKEDEKEDRDDKEDERDDRDNKKDNKNKNRPLPRDLCDEAKSHKKFDQKKQKELDNINERLNDNNTKYNNHNNSPTKKRIEQIKAKHNTKNKTNTLANNKSNTTNKNNLYQPYRGR